MIKKVLICSAFLAAGLSILTLEDHESHSNTTGSPGGYTGAPSDGGATCRTCHSPGSAPIRENIFTTDIPANGYVPGATYTVTITATEAGRSKFGFECTAQNSSAKKGTFSNINANQTRTISSQRITHQSTGTTGTAGTKVWTFNWKAPVAGNGEITFYAAINASNANNNDDGGDIIFTAKTSVQEAKEAGIADYISQLSKVKLFPNPASNVINVEVPSDFGKIYSIELIDLSGKSLMKHTDTTVDISTLPNGTYLVLTHGETTAVSRFVKQ